uniref:DUF4515 domain-containing protein n=1 Tax=Erpetoichthys calabaricus TaxID=27687 RepID=A0A8C4RT46_ERPCA
MPKKKKKAVAESSVSEAEDSGLDPEEKEAIMKKEYEQLSEHLEELKLKAENLRHENEFLQEEVRQTQLENQECASYMSKSTQKRQNIIITLSDQNQQQMMEIQKKTEAIQAQFMEARDELASKILQKENELAKLTKEIEALREFKLLQQEQLSRIAELEKEVMQMRGQHCQRLLDVKARCLQEKASREEAAKQQVQALVVAANKEASRCLQEHTQNIVLENRRLRQELLELIRRAETLRTQQVKLQAQKQLLLNERKYTEDLRQLRRRQKD